MGETTGIKWTDHTFNPWWGCEKIANPDGSGCDHCYAADLARRYGHDVWGKGEERRMLSDGHWRQPLKWDRDAEEAGRPALVFCASMGDVFEDRRDLDESRARLWSLIGQTPNLVWQLLTKRPERARSLVPREWMHGGWPPNVWAGTTVVHQPDARLRVPRLLALPAAVRFLSVEPMLGPVTLDRWLPLEWMDALRAPGAPPSFRTEDGEGGWGLEMFAALRGDRSPIGWVICGGESGPGRRPFDLAWARDLRDQCAAAEVPFFFKQDAGAHPGAPGPDDLDPVKQFPAEALR